MRLKDKVAFIVEQVAKHDCALRIGVNCGSVDPAMAEKFDGADEPLLHGVTAMVESALRYADDDETDGDEDNAQG